MTTPLPLDQKRFKFNFDKDEWIEVCETKDIKLALQNFQEEILDWNMAGEFKGFIKVNHAIQILTKHFGTSLTETNSQNNSDGQAGSPVGSIPNQSEPIDKSQENEGLKLNSDIHSLGSNSNDKKGCGI